MCIRDSMYALLKIFGPLGLINGWFEGGGLSKMENMKNSRTDFNQLARNILCNGRSNIGYIKSTEYTNCIIVLYTYKLLEIK